jgi:hypothetical protein
MSELAAYHEAGHTVAMFLFGHAIDHVSIVPDEDSHGRAISKSFLDEISDDGSNWSIEMRQRFEEEIIVFLAGPAAQERFSGNRHVASEGDDLAKAMSIAIERLGMPENEADAYIKWLDIRASSFVTSRLRWPLVESIARELLARGHFDGAFAEATMRSALDAEIPPLPFAPLDP